MNITSYKAREENPGNYRPNLSAGESQGTEHLKNQQVALVQQPGHQVSVGSWKEGPA